MSGGYCMNRKILYLSLFVLIFLLISLSVFVLTFNNNMNNDSSDKISDDKSPYLYSYIKRTYSSSFELINEENTNDYYVFINNDIFSFCDNNSDCYTFKFKKELIDSNKGSISSYVPVDDSESIDYYFVAIDSVDGYGDDIIQVTKGNNDGNYVILYFK